MDDQLEAAIDKAGRAEVFRRAEANGWRPGSLPPKYVWWQIVNDIEHGRPSGTSMTRSMPEGILGGLF